MKNKKIIVLIIGILVLICLGMFCFIRFRVDDKDSVRFKKEYESLNGTIRKKDGKRIRSIEISENNPMVYSDEDEIVRKINNKETFLVYFGFADCPWCRSVLPNLIKAAKALGLSEIYYVDVAEIRDTIEYEDGAYETVSEGTDGYYKLLDLMSDVLDDYMVTDDEGNEISTNEKRIFAPNVVAIVEGKATQLTDGISEEQTDGYMELTDDMNEESYNDFKCVIKCIVDNKKVCSKEKAC